jgi:hypothetical protein
VFNVSILIEKGDPYGECDMLITQCIVYAMPRVGEYITINLKEKYLIHKIQHSVLTEQKQQFIEIYVYKV